MSYIVNEGPELKQDFMVTDICSVMQCSHLRPNVNSNEQKRSW